ncbi:hypothetical protein D5281_23480 [bacterium 1xD42-62]|uniref:DUF6431 domain-containing protein n=1 Tax=Parablautia muri TaxID=2320879 RepID=A0A9X5BKH6_9FIRM|nr:hypothetical protein [Parablautia muri]
MRIYLITSKEESVCPCCGSPLKYRDSRRCVQRKAGGGKEWCLIRRLRCSNDRCRRLHNELLCREDGNIIKTFLQTAPDGAFTGGHKVRAGSADNFGGTGKDLFILAER